MDILIFCETEKDVSFLSEVFSDNGVEFLKRDRSARSLVDLSPDIIVTGANILITVINAILSIVKEKQNNKIKIKGNNWEIEIPDSKSKAEVKELINMARIGNDGAIKIFVPGEKSKSR